MSISIILDNNNQNIYCPGQMITGRVECHFTKKKSLRAIRIKFRGRANVRWSESKRVPGPNGKSRSRSVTYSAEEKYVNVDYTLVEGGDNFSLSAGQHIYPFSYILPTQLPSSFHGIYGKIEYYIKATVDRPWKFNYEAKYLLNVVSPLDLNSISGIREPVATSDEKTTFSWWRNDSGTLTFNVSLPISGYTPGQPINIGAYVQNMTNVSVEEVRFKVVEHIEFISKSPTTRHKYSKNNVVKCREGGIGAHGEKSWTSTLIIPTERVYTNLLSCWIIDISYKLIAKAVIPSPHTNLKLEIPIKIGHIPLANVNTFLPGPPTGFDPQLPPYTQNGKEPYSFNPETSQITRL